MSRIFRHVVNFGLLFCFITLAATGVMAFALPFDVETTRVHVIFGVLTFILVGLHVGSRLRYFKQQGTGAAKNGISRQFLAGIVGVWILLLLAAISNWKPVDLVIGQSHESRHRSAIVRPSPLSASMDSDAGVIAARRQEATDNVVLRVHVGLAQGDTPRPAIAIWAESTAGAMIETLYLSGDVAYSDQPEWQGKETARKEILPVWRHRYTLVTGVDPDGEVDAVTGATENHQFSLDGYLQNDADDYVIFVEINASGDPSGEWTDAHVGQPSVLYSVFVEHRARRSYFLGELIGHGGDAETSGEISYDLERLGSAKALVDLILVSSAPIEKMARAGE